MQEFSEKILSNGIKLYHYAADFPVSTFEIMLPVGSAHAGVKGGVIPNGAPHFLEHMQMLRSLNYPEKGSLDKKIGLEGGHNNAHTSAFWTSYEMTVPTDSVEATLPGLVDRVFSSIFDASDLENQRQIIITEADQQRRFFPGNSPSGKYYNTRFLHDEAISLERIFGSKTQLTAFTPELLRDLHRLVAATEGVVAFSGGSHDPHFFADLLERIAPTKRTIVPTEFHKTFWVKPEYHEKKFENIRQPSLEVSWILPRTSYEEQIGLAFLFNLLCNNIHGFLYEKLREEKGWIYDLDWYDVYRPEQQLYGMSFPVMNTKIIKEVRTSLFDWMQEAIVDQVRVEKEIHRRLRQRVTWYETSAGTVYDEADIYRNQGRILNHDEWERAIRRMADPIHRQFLFDTYMSKKEWFGEMAFLPED